MPPELIAGFAASASVFALGTAFAFGAGAPPVFDVTTASICADAECAPKSSSPELKVADVAPERLDFAGDAAAACQIEGVRAGGAQCGPPARPSDELDFPDYAGAAYWKALAMAVVQEPPPIAVFDHEGTVVLKGLPAGTKLSVGNEIAPTAWLVPQSELKNLVLTLPPGAPLTFAVEVDVLSRTGLRTGGMRLAIRQEEARAAETVPPAPSTVTPQTSTVAPAGAPPAPAGTEPAEKPAAAPPQQKAAVEPPARLGAPVPKDARPAAEKRPVTKESKLKPPRRIVQSKPKKVQRPRPQKPVAKEPALARASIVKTKTAEAKPAAAAAPAVISGAAPQAQSPNPSKAGPAVVENAGVEILIGLGAMPRAMDAPIEQRATKKP